MISEGKKRGGRLSTIGYMRGGARRGGVEDDRTRGWGEGEEEREEKDCAAPFCL